jgi:hypothetical protein
MDPYALAADGSAKDPRAFQEALRQDAEKMAQLEKVWVVASPHLCAVHQSPCTVAVKFCTILTKTA